MSDTTLARFISYMEIVLYHKRIDYINKILEVNKHEEELQDYKIEKITINENHFIDLDGLNDKEKELIEMLYVKGYSYKEISKKTKVSVKALELRRYRAVLKLRKSMEESNGK